jgi:hypothetical protein
MDSTVALRVFQESLDKAGLVPDMLDPWETWKLFKSFMRTPLGGGYDIAGVQFATHPDTQGLYFIRQLSARDEFGEDVLVWQMTVELFYKNPNLERARDLDIWSLDFKTLEEFASVVEGEDTFQRAISAAPFVSDCRTDEV